MLCSRNDLHVPLHDLSWMFILMYEQQMLMLFECLHDRPIVDVWFKVQVISRAQITMAWKTRVSIDTCKKADESLEIAIQIKWNDHGHAEIPLKYIIPYHSTLDVIEQRYIHGVLQIRIKEYQWKDFNDPMTTRELTIVREIRVGDASGNFSERDEPMMAMCDCAACCGDLIVLKKDVPTSMCHICVSMIPWAIILSARLVAFGCMKCMLFFVEHLHFSMCQITRDASRLDFVLLDVYTIC